MADNPASTHLTEQERGALVNADNLYGANAKLAAGVFVGGLGLKEEYLDEISEAVARAIDGIPIVDDNGIPTFEQKREIAGHFGSLAKYLGSTSLAELDEVPEPHTATVASDEDSTGLADVVDVPIAAPEVVSEKLALKTSPENDKLTGSPLTVLVKVFGEDKREIVEVLTDEQLSILGEELGRIYEELSITRQTAQGKIARSQQIKMLLTGTSVDEIAEKFGVSKAAVSQGLVIKMPQSITKRVPKDDLDALLEQIVGSPEVFAVPDLPSQTDSSAAQEKAKEITPLEKPQDLKTAIEMLTTTLRITDKMESKDLEMIFNVGVSDVFRGEVINTLREDVKTIIDCVQSDPSLREDQLLDSLEEDIMHAIVGNKDQNRPALSVRSVKGKMGKELGQSRRKIEEVITTAIWKLSNARQKYSGTNHAIAS